MAATPHTSGAASSSVRDRSQASDVSGASAALDLVERITDGIRARRPGVTTLPEVARRVQAELVPAAGRDPLLPETVQAVDRVFADLYSDADALAAIQAAWPALSANPREIKRYVNLFRFYTFVLERQRLEGFPVPRGDSIARLAALAIRWPYLLTAFADVNGDDSATSLVGRLEAAARAESDEAWHAAMAEAGLMAKDKDGKPLLPEWSSPLRRFLEQDPKVGDLAARLL